MMNGETGVTRFSPALGEVHQVLVTVPEGRVGRDDPPTAVGTRSPRESGPTRGVVGDWRGAALCHLLGVLVSRWLSTPLRRIGLVAERFANGAYEARVHALGVLHTREPPPWPPSSTAWRMK